VTELTEQVRTLRQAGNSPKEIARALGARPAEVTAIVRALAAESATGEPAVVGAWISHGWSAGLTVDGHPDWPDVARADVGQRGMACVVVARRHRPQRVSVCGYLVDTYCLGVKNALGPRVMNDRDLPAFLHTFFSAIQDGEPPLGVPVVLARHVVCGAVDYARGLGFEPHADYAATATHLGAWEGSSAITFGQDGVPTYVSGPHDNPRAVMRTLTRTVGEGNFHYLVPM
jgi:hypothetical protein